MSFLKNISFSVKIFIMFALVMSFSAGIVYILGQQILRMNANDPQIQIAWDAAYKLGLGSDPAKLAPIDQVSVNVDQGPFMIIYDSSYQAVAGNAMYKGVFPNIPRGVLEYANTHGGDRVTWQPDSTTRIALIVQKAPNGKGFVAVGRSLGEVERRTSNLLYLIVLAWIVSLLIGAALSLALFANITNRNIKKLAS